MVAGAESGKEQERHYVYIMPADMPLCDYFVKDNDVAVAGKVTDSDIVIEVLDSKGVLADEDPSDSDKPPHHTMMQAVHALAVLENIGIVFSDSVRGLSHLQKLRKIVISLRISSVKQTITDFFNK